MAELMVDILKLIYKAFRKIKEEVKTLDQNNEDLRNIGKLVDCWSQILLPLKTKPAMLEDPGISVSVKRLWESLDRAKILTTDTNSNSMLSIVLNAEDKANELLRLQQELSQRIATVTGAMTAYSAVCAATIMESHQPPPSQSQASSSSLPMLLMDIQSTEAPEAPLQLHQIARGPRNSIKYLRHNENRNKPLDVYPLELRFPFEPNKKIQCPVTLTNRTGHYVSVWITQIFPTHEQFICPRSTMIRPYSTMAISVTMKEHMQQPHRYTCTLEVLMVAVWLKSHLENLTSVIDGKLNMDKQGVSPQLVHILEQAEELHGEVYRAKLTAVICDPANCPIISIPTEHMPITSAIDVHPTKPWILMVHEGGTISIWNYQTQECMKTFKVTKEREIRGFFIIQKYRKNSYGFPHWIYSAKLIARKCLLAAGDGSGFVHIYSLIYNLTNGTTVKKVTKFSAYSGKPVDTLAVHPSKPYLFSSSTFHGKIRLWDWDKDWVKIREFDVNTCGVRSLTFNPRDTDTFACITIDRKAKVLDLGEDVVDSNESTNLQVWNIHDQSSWPTNTLPVGPYNADFLFTQSHLHCFMVTSGSPKQCTCESTASCTEIWDMQKNGEVVHTLRVSGDSKTRGVACHPTLPILVTTLDDGTVCLWDARTYRLEKMVHIKYSSSKEALVFTAGTNDSRTRLVVGFESMIAIIGVKITQCQGSNSGLVVGAIYEMP